MLKKYFVRSTVDTVLLYGSITWTLTTNLAKKLDGTHTRMLRAILNKSWRYHPTHTELYGSIPQHHILYGKEEFDKQVTDIEVTNKL